MAGYFYLERGWSESPCFTGLHDRFAWVWLIEAACFAPKTINVGGTPMLLQRGECFYSINYLAKAWFISPMKTRLILKRLEKWQMVYLKSNKQGTHVTICNYEKYQNKHEQSNKQTTSRATNEQRTNNNNNKEGLSKDKEERNLMAANFSAFHEAFPKKTKRREAAKAYARIVKSGVSPDLILQAAKDFAAARSWGSDIQFCINPFDWLDSGGYKQVKPRHNSGWVKN